MSARCAVSVVEVERRRRGRVGDHGCDGHHGPIRHPNGGLAFTEKRGSAVTGRTTALKRRTSNGRPDKIENATQGGVTGADRGRS